MKKFDLVYEKVVALLEEREYVESTFSDNLRQLVKILIANDYLNKEKDSEEFVKEMMNQQDNIKELNLDTEEQSLPAVKLQIKQEEPDSESFSVTVVDLENPDQQKTFSNTVLESIFDDVVSYIKQITLQGAKPEEAVEELPQTEGPAGQPGAGESALPGAGGETAPPEGEQPPQGQQPPV